MSVALSMSAPGQAQAQGQGLHDRPRVAGSHCSPGSRFIAATGPCMGEPPCAHQCWMGTGGWQAGTERGTHLHADVTQAAVVGPGRAVEAALPTPLQAEGLVVHPDHMHCPGTLFVGAWHGKRMGQRQRLLQQPAAVGGSTVSLGSRNGSGEVGRGNPRPRGAS